MHNITFVNDEAIPEGHDFIYIQAGARALIFYRESAVTPQTLEDSWAAYRAMDRRPPVEPASAPTWAKMLHVA